MSNKKQTSVDWLAEQTEIAIKKFLSKIKNPTKEEGRAAGELGLIIKDTLQTARQMHREEVEGAVSVGRNTHIKAKDHYTQTFETP